MIGVGRLESIDTQGTSFSETEGCQSLFASWDAIYKEGRWIKANALQFSVPLGVSLDTAEQLLQEGGPGVFFDVNLSCTSSNIGIMWELERLKEEITPGLEYLGRNRQGHEEYRNLKDNSIMVKIPAGEFLMGSNDGQSAEKPVHKVYLDAYYIDKHEVTNKQYREFVEATGHRAPRQWGDDNHPVAYVSWEDAVAYATWTGKRLPTEAEWEKAARGGLVGKKYPWGNSIDSSKTNYGKKVGQTTPVGSYPPNNYGLYDMAGNVWEFCSDWWHDDYYSSSPYRNPQGPSNGSYRVYRGGGWYNVASNLRCAYRCNYGPDSTSFNLGFRCVKSP